VTGPHGPVAQDLARSGIRVIPAQPLRLGHNWPVWPRRLMRYSIMTVLYLRFALRHRKAILHFFLPQATIFGGILTIAWHPRLIASQRGMLSHRAKYLPLMTWIERLVLRNMTLNLANSRGVARTLLVDGVSADKIRVVYSGLSESRIDPGYAGKLVPVQGPCRARRGAGSARQGARVGRRLAADMHWP
jgi:hypothetical protein